MRRDSFVCYKSFYDAIKQLSDEDFARCMRAICEYALNGAEVDIQGVPSVVFQLVKPQIDANNRKFLNGMRGKECGNLGKEYGKLGGRPKTPQETPQETPQSGEKNPPNVNVNDNVNVNVNDNVNVNVSSVANATAPPTKKTVAIEARREQLLTDMRKYENIYSSEMLNAFYQYWSEPNQKNTKMRFELEKTWLLSSRLATWEKRENTYKKNSYGKNFTNTAKLSNDTIRNIVESNDAGSFGEK